MKWLRYTTIPIGIFMLVLSLLAPKVQASSLNYDLQIVNGSTIDAFDSTVNESSRYRTGYVEIINDSIIMTYTGTWSFGGIFWYNGSTHIGWHNLVSYDNRGQLLGTIPLVDFDKLHNYAPANATHFRITTRNENVITVTYDNPTPTDITTYDNILWNDDTWVNINGGLTAQQYYYVSYLIDVNALSSYDIIANDNPNFSNLAPNVTHIWYYDSNYALIGSYNAYMDFAYYTPDLTLNAHYIRIGAPVTNLGGYEPQFIKSTYISTTNRTLKYLNHLGSVVYQTSEVFVGDSTATYDALAEANLPNREGYVFSNWSGLTAVGNDPITTKEPIYNQLAQYVVTFLDYDGTFISSGLVYQGQSAPLPTAPTRQHYIFSHWEPPVADVQGNITTYAQYTPVQYQVTWKAPDGSTLKIEMVSYSGLAQAPIYTPSSGLVLDGWLDQDDVTQTVKQSPILVDGQDKIFTATTSIAPEPEPVNPNLPPEDYNPITDLLGGVMGASVGAIMTLGTINLFGIYLYQLIFLFIGTTLTLWILKAVRG